MAAAASVGGAAQVKRKLWFEKSSDIVTVEQAIVAAGLDIHTFVDRSVEQLRGDDASIALAKAHIASFPDGGWPVSDEELPLALLLLVNWALRMAPRRLVAAWGAMGVPCAHAVKPELARALLKESFDARHLVALLPASGRPPAKNLRDALADTDDRCLSWSQRCSKHLSAAYHLMRAAGCDTLGRCGEAVGWKHLHSPGAKEDVVFSEALRSRLRGTCAALPAARAASYAAGALHSWPCSPAAFCRVYRDHEPDYDSPCSVILQVVRVGTEERTGRDAGVKAAIKKGGYFAPVEGDDGEDGLDLVTAGRAEREEEGAGSCDPLHPLVSPSVSRDSVELLPAVRVRELAAPYYWSWVGSRVAELGEEEAAEYREAGAAPTVGQLVLRKLAHQLRARFGMEGEAAGEGAAAGGAAEGSSPAGVQLEPLEGGPLPLYRSKGGPPPLPDEAARSLLRAAGVVAEQRDTYAAVRAALNEALAAVLAPVAGVVREATASASGPAAPLVTSSAVGAALRSSVVVYGNGVTCERVSWPGLADQDDAISENLLFFDWRFLAALHDATTDVLLRVVAAAARPISPAALQAAAASLLPAVELPDCSDADAAKTPLRLFPASIIQAVALRELGTSLDDDAAAAAAIIMTEFAKAAMAKCTWGFRNTTAGLAPGLAAVLTWPFAVAHGGQPHREKLWEGVLHGESFAHIAACARAGGRAEELDPVHPEEARRWSSSNLFAHPIDGRSYGVQMYFEPPEADRVTRIEPVEEVDARDSRSAAERRAAALAALSPGDHLIVQIDEGKEECALLMRQLAADTAMASLAPLLPTHLFADAAFHALAAAGAAGHFEPTLDALLSLQFAVEAATVAALRRAAVAKLGATVDLRDNMDEEELEAAMAVNLRPRWVLAAADLTDLQVLPEAAAAPGTGAAAAGGGGAAGAASGRALPARPRVDEEEAIGGDEEEDAEEEEGAAPSTKRVRGE